MLSYQHSYHAGNPADLHKHLVLAGFLTLLTQKPLPLTYMETHAGRGLYDLASAEALKTGEAEFGIGTISGGDHPFFATVDAVREKYGPSAYPGSPLIAQMLLRPQDRLELMELHPQEHAALRRNLAAANTSIHFRDGFGGVLALSPPKARHGLVLIDPSYEIKSDYTETAAFAASLMQVWPEACILIWFPILVAGRHQDLLTGLAPLQPIVDMRAFRNSSRLRMAGTGLALINLPKDGALAVQTALRFAGHVLVPI